MNELYQKAGVTRDFGSDGSDIKSKLKAQANVEKQRYRCVKRAVVRAEFDSSSSKVGTLDEGTEVEVSESKLNKKGQLRVKFTSAKMKGWTSTTSGDGAELMVKIERPAPAADDGDDDAYDDDGTLEPEPEMDEEQTLMDQYLEYFVAQKLQAKSGRLTAAYDGDKTLSVAAVMFMCTNLESTRQLLTLRQQVVDELTEDDVPIPRCRSVSDAMATQFEVELKQTHLDDDEDDDALFVFKVTSRSNILPNGQASWFIKKTFADFLDVDEKLRKKFEVRCLLFRIFAARLIICALQPNQLFKNKQTVVLRRPKIFSCYQTRQSAW